MKKVTLFISGIAILSGCSILSEITAFNRCEFSFHSAEDPALSGIDISNKQSFQDFRLMDGQVLLSNIARGTLPFSVVANVEVRNPGTTTAAVNAIDWLAFIDHVQVAEGTVSDRVVVPPGGGTSIIPIQIRTDLFQYLEGDNARTMLNFALNLVDAGGQPTRLSMKIKPSVMVGSQSISYPGYFTINKEFNSGN